MDLQDPSPAPGRPGRFTRAGIAVLGAVAAVAVLWMLFSPRPLRYAGSSHEGLPSAAPPVGRPAPDFRLSLFSGGTLTLRSLRGKPVVLNFWASWCVPCREETPRLVRLYKIYKLRGVVFVGVDVEDQKAEALAFIKQFHVDYPVVVGSDDVMEAYQVQGIPTTVFIGADGVVRDKFAGGFVGPAGEQALVSRLDRLLGSDKP